MLHKKADLQSYSPWAMIHANGPTNGIWLVAIVKFYSCDFSWLLTPDHYFNHLSLLGMTIVKKMEKLGSGSGKTSKVVVIANCGEVKEE